MDIVDFMIQVHPGLINWTTGRARTGGKRAWKYCAALFQSRTYASAFRCLWPL